MASRLARELRKNPTDAEVRLWSRLRGKHLDGFRFRRQQPIGPYIADFFCPEARLIVEVDGSQHHEDDGSRTAWLESRGYRVVRFWNNEVLTNTASVLQVVLDALHKATIGKCASPLEGEVAPEGRVGGTGAAFSVASDMRHHTPHPSPHSRRRPPPQGGRGVEGNPK